MPVWHSSKQPEEEGEDEEEGDCDSCRKPAKVVECPSSWEEMKWGVKYYKRFCEECCASIYDYEGCQDDVEDCDRADRLFTRQLDASAVESGLERNIDYPHIYFDKSKIYCISTHHVSPETVFKDKPCAWEECHFFMGENDLIAKTEKGATAYRISALDEVKKIFKRLRLSSSRYLVLTKSRLLIVDGYPAWAAIAPLAGEEESMSALFAEEKRRFIDRTMEGAAFFGIQSRKDDLIIARPSKLNIDWSRIDNRKFQELCRDLLRTLPGVKEARITGGPGEWGQDIEMLETVRDLTGETDRRWVIQCKHIMSRSLTKSDLAISSFEAFLKFDYDVYCVMTSAIVSPGCYYFLDMIQKDKRVKIKCEVFDRKRLEDLVKVRPDVYAAYFG